MKYGEQFERDSVPQWSFHNLDYNSLKNEIKKHTTRDHATAMTIPGHQDPALVDFENALYDELCRQHDRVHLFVSSKADEILRRMEHLDYSIKRRVEKYSRDTKSVNVALRRQRRLAKYDCELLNCGSDIGALQRFSNAQLTAFRKILKKYKKWTGSPTLQARFNDQVLGNFKSFTRRDFAPLSHRHYEIISNLRDVALVVRNATDSRSSSFSTDLPPSPISSSSNNNNTSRSSSNRNNSITDRVSRVSFDQLPRPSSSAAPPPLTKYWNEYDNGSDAGDDFAGVTIAADDDDDGDNGVYAIYIDPRDDKSAFPGLGYVHALAAALPYQKIRRWFRPKNERAERRWLLAPENSGRRGPQPAPYGGAAADGYLSTTTVTCTDSEEDNSSGGDGDAACTTGTSATPYSTATTTHQATAAHRSISEQQLRRYRQRTLRLGTAAAFVAAYLLMGVAGLLFVTGRRRLRVEVDVGVAVAVAISLCCACAGLGASLYARSDALALPARLLVWLSFTLACLVNGMLLIMVVGNAP